MLEVAISSMFLVSRGRKRSNLQNDGMIGVAPRLQMPTAPDNAAGGGAYTQN
jgi:hypothetical protein